MMNCESNLDSATAELFLYENLIFSNENGFKPVTYLTTLSFSDDFTRSACVP